MTERKTMVTHSEDIKILSILPDEERLLMYDAMFVYGFSRKTVEVPEKLYYLYKVVIGHLESDFSKYERIIESRIKAGKMSYLSRCAKNASGADILKGGKGKSGKGSKKVTPSITSTEDSGSEFGTAGERGKKAGSRENNIKGISNNEESQLKKELYRPILPETPDASFIETDPSVPWFIPNFATENTYKATQRKSNADMENENDGCEQRENTELYFEHDTLQNESSGVPPENALEQNIASNDTISDTMPESTCKHNTIPNDAIPDIPSQCNHSTIDESKNTITSDGVVLLNEVVEGYGVKIPEHLLKEWGVELGS